MATYRLLALEQVARVVRGTPAATPSDRLERDLYAVAEAAAVDRQLSHELGGIVADLRAARARALSERPSLERLTALEHRVEQLVRATLAADPATPPSDVPLSATPDGVTPVGTHHCGAAARTAASYRG